MAGCRWAGRVFAISSSLRRGPLGLEGSASREAGTFGAAGHQRAHPPGFPCGSSPAAGARGRGLPEEAEEDELVGASSDDSEVGVSHGLVTTKLDVVMAPRLNVEIRGRVLNSFVNRLVQASGARHTPRRPPPGSLSQHQTPDARREAAGVVPGLAGTRDWGETSRSVNAGGVASGPPPLSPSQQHRGAADRPARAETPPWPQGGPSASPPARPGACAEP